MKKRDSPGSPCRPARPRSWKIDAGALVTVRANHIQAAERSLVLATEPDVGAAAGHVRGDRDRATRPGAGDDRRFHHVVSRVQHLAGHASVAKPRREPFGFFDRQRADQHGPSGRVRPPDFFDDRAFLGVAMCEDDVRPIDADHRPVRGHDHHLAAIELSAVPRRRSAPCRSCRTGEGSRAENAAG